ncbi:MAG: chloride channel protein [Bdellovibrionaceae bacterium]|nr:chloride channel protein [Pseudobdellovibrionaceae bacterium]
MKKRLLEIRHHGHLFAAQVVREQLHLSRITFWVAAVLAACVSVFFAQVFQGAEVLRGLVLSWSPWLIFLICPVACLISWVIVRRFAPGASGSGIPQVLAAVEVGGGEIPPERLAMVLSPRILVIKILATLIAVFGGAAIGREGPTIQIAAGVFLIFGLGFRRFFPNSDLRSWMVGGASAGLAAAFNTPLGGIVYAIEEVGSAYFHRFKSQVLVAVILAGVVSQAMVGNYLYIGDPRFETTSPWTFLVVFIVALLSGLAGGGMARALSAGSKFYGQLVERKKEFPFVLLMIALMTILAWLVPEAAGAGRDAISKILFESWSPDFLSVIGRVLGPVLSYFAVGAGGIFAPSLSAGAVVGASIAEWMQIPNVNLCALVGMTAFLAGVTRTPFTAFILVLEMTNRHTVIFFLMLAALVGNRIAAICFGNQGFYEIAMHGWVKRLNPEATSSPSSPVGPAGQKQMI